MEKIQRFNWRHLQNNFTYSIVIYILNQTIYITTAIYLSFLYLYDGDWTVFIENLQNFMIQI